MIKTNIRHKQYENVCCCVESAKPEYYLRKLWLIFLGYQFNGLQVNGWGVLPRLY